MDCGNPRYAASRASSIIGGLLNKVHDKDVVSVIVQSETNATDAVEAGEGEVQEQDKVTEELTFNPDDESGFFSLMKKETGLEDDQATIFSVTTKTTEMAPTTAIISEKCKDLQSQLNQ